MKDNKVSVFGLFKNEGQINLAVTELTAYGFRHEDMASTTARKPGPGKVRS